MKDPDESSKSTVLFQAGPVLNEFNQYKSMVPRVVQCLPVDHLDHRSAEESRQRRACPNLGWQSLQACQIDAASRHHDDFALIQRCLPAVIFLGDVQI